MRRLLERFRRPASPDAGTAPVEKRADLLWTDLEAADLSQHTDLFDELVAGQRDGVTVHSLFSEEEIAGALDRLDREVAGGTPSVIGTVIGMPIGHIGEESTDRTPFLDDSDRSRALYREAFGFDPHERLAEALDPAAGGRPLVPAQEEGRFYNPGQVRCFEPGSGGLRAHAGNEFNEILGRGAMSHLVRTTRVTDHLSYFVVLQRPDEGGSLSVFDLVWEETSSVGQSWSSGERPDAFFDRFAHMTIDPAPGSLVLFGGGRRWHRVEPVNGDRTRITYGGFCAPSIDGAEIHFWT